MSDSAIVDATSTPEHNAGNLREIDAAKRRTAGFALLLAASVATLLGAGLGFAVQPLVSRLLLPRLGGGASVWNTTLVFFQATLLLGYLVTHFTSTKLSPRAQVGTHLGLLLVGLVVLPVDVPRTWQPPADQNPGPWLLFTLAIVVGLPYLAVATTSPLVQRWFSTSGHRSAVDPYFLYAISNVGSFAGLLIVPFVLDRTLSLRLQSRWWAVVYICFLVACVAVVVLARPDLAGRERVSGEAVTVGRGNPTLRVGMATWWSWAALAFVPSSLILAVTAHLTTDVASVPMLWVMPLGLYLLTHIIAFGRRALPSGLLRAAAGISVAIAAANSFAPFLSFPWSLSPDLAALFFVGLACHGRLAAMRPPSEKLTSFYVALSTGGVLGGMFAALVAPVVFSRVIEYPLLLTIAAALVCIRRGHGPTLRPIASPVVASPVTTSPSVVSGASETRIDELSPEDPALLDPTILAIADPDTVATHAVMTESVASPDVTVSAIPNTAASPIQRSRWIDSSAGRWALTLLFALPIAALVPAVREYQHRSLLVALVFAAVVGFYAFSQRWLFAAAMVAILSVLSFRDSTIGSVRFGRSFYGALQVQELDGFRQLVHGTTTHGYQSLNPPDMSRPTSYYNRLGAVGRSIESLRSRLGTIDRIGVVGLGVGTIATYLYPGESLTYYEIDPLVVKLASDRSLFTYLSDAKGDVDIVLGDGRRSLQDTDKQFEFLAIDAFTSDAIPVHLLTVEAVKTYADRLAPGGLLAIHVSNRYLDLEPVVAAIAKKLDLAAIGGHYGADEAEEAAGGTSSDWIVLAKDATYLDALPGDIWADIRSEPGVRAWTDDRIDILDVLITD